MKKGRVFGAVAAALVAGVILGSAVSGFAATSNAGSAGSTNTVAAACAGLGLRLGSTMRDSGGRLLDIVAKLTGKTTTQVVADRQAGKTFAQIAAEKNVSATAVVDEAVKVRSSVLAQKVKAGTITQAQADAALAQMKTQLTTRVDSANTACTGSGAGCGQGAGRGQGGGGCGGAGCGAAQ